MSQHGDHDNQYWKLKSLAEAIAGEIFLAQEAYFLSELIGKNADALNVEYANLFGRLQGIFSDWHTLAIAKLFEEPRRYPVRSIPAALKFLERMPANSRFSTPTLCCANCRVACTCRGAF
jgi:hypothetical protein